MNELYCELSQNAVGLNSFNCVFVHEEVRCANKTDFKDGLQYAYRKTITISLENSIL